MKPKMYFLKLFLFVCMFAGMQSNAQSPGGVATTASTQGLRYDLYSNASNTLANMRSASPSYGTFKQSGYVQTIKGMPDLLDNEIWDDFVVVSKGLLTITNAGTYDFAMNNIDDIGVIIVNGVEVYYGENSTSTDVYVPIALTPGIYTIEIRYAEQLGITNCQPYWKSATPGADAGNSYTDIPDSKFTIASPRISSWYKANTGLTGADGSAATSWLDQSGNSNLTNLSNIGTNSPLARTSSQLMNFNPTVQFSRLGGMVSGDDANNLSLSKKSHTIISVTKPLSSSSHSFLVDIGRDEIFNTHSFLENFDNALSNGYGEGTIGSTLATPGFFTNGVAQIVESNIEKGTTLATQNDNIIKQFANGSNTALGSIIYNGGNVSLNDNKDFSIGSKIDDVTVGTTLDGNIAEVITYPWAISNTERNKIHTYLAIKYGITMAADALYVSSNGTTIWDPALNTGYINNVTGIGQDLASALNQKQSQSQNAGMQPVYTNGSAFTSTNAANTNTIADGSFWVVSDNGGSELINVITGFGTNRMARIWKRTKTGSVNNVRIAIPSVVFAGIKQAKLLTGVEPTFNTATSVLVVNNGTVFIDNAEYTIFNLGANDYEYFTFAGDQAGPGGVTAGLALWLKANEGLVIGNKNKWTDQSGNSNTVLQSATANEPALDNPVNNRSNFNPAYYFNGANTHFNKVVSGSNLPVNGPLSTFTAAMANDNNSGGPYQLWSYGDDSPGIEDHPSNNGFRVLNGNTEDQYYAYSNAGSYFDRRGHTNILSGFFGAYIGGVNTITLNGSTSSAPASNHTGSFGGTLAIGYEPSPSAEYYDGWIAEHIMYNTDFSASAGNELARIKSYLGIKYGTTMHTGSGTPTVAAPQPMDYLNSDGTVIWNGVANAAYHNFVAGIGRDDNSALNQKQSISNKGLNTAGGQVYGQVAISLGTLQQGTLPLSGNALNTGSFANDKSFMVWGDNGNQENYATATTAFTWNGSSTNKRINRIWRVQNSGVTANVTVNFSKDLWGNAGTPPTLAGCQQKVLIIATDAAFASIVEVYPLVDGTFNLETLLRQEANNVTIPQGASYFTIGVVDNATPGVVYLPTTATTTAANPNECKNSSRTYYYDAAVRTHKIFAIDWNTNTVPAGVTGLVTYSAAHYPVTNGGEKTTLMGRLVTVTPAGGSFAPALKVRIYYSPAELAASEAISGTILVSQKWFKYPGDAAAVIAANNGSQIPGAVYLTPNVTGIEDGINYVEFHNITSFSTFGYASKSGLIALPLHIVSFTGQKLNETTVSLNWKISDDFEAEKYELQFSTDGFNYTTAATIFSQGRNEATYSQVTALYSPKTFYRLKVIFKSGVVNYSSVILFNAASQNTSIKLYPNPATKNNNNVSLVLNGYDKGANCSIINAVGQNIKTATLNNGQNNIDVAGLSSGIYYIRITDKRNGIITMNKLVVE